MPALQSILVACTLGGALAARVVREHGDGMDLDIASEVPTGVLADHCNLKESACNIGDMKRLTYVYPGGKTQCMNGAAYSFAVIPGDSDKLMFHFAGGGACWQKKYPKWPATKTASCFQWSLLGQVATAPGIGAFNFWDKSNVFHGHTMVSAVYCGGGAHVADSEIKTWLRTYKQRDYWNVKAVQDWTLGQFGGLSSFVVVGVSAGSLGSAFWARDFFSKFQYQKASMVWDSYSGVFPADTQGEQLQAWGVCNIPIISSEAKKLCDAQELSVDWIAEEAIKTFPEVNFVSIQSKGDSTQRSFYKKVAETLLGKEMELSAQGFENQTKVFYDRYNQYPNYQTYWVDGDQHCFLVWPHYYTTNHAGPLKALPPGDLNPWLGGVIRHETMG